MLEHGNPCSSVNVADEMKVMTVTFAVKTTIGGRMTLTTTVTKSILIEHQGIQTVSTCQVVTGRFTLSLSEDARDASSAQCVALRDAGCSEMDRLAACTSSFQAGPKDVICSVPVTCFQTA